MNEFPYSDTNKRYHTYDYYLKHTFGSKCVKIPLDAGFSCPNRENGAHGCSFCSPRGSGDQCTGLSGGVPRPGAVTPTIREQLSEGYARLLGKWTGSLSAKSAESLSAKSTGSLSTKSARRGKTDGGELPVIPYFQAFTCTYAPAPLLEKIYREALCFPDAEGKRHTAAAVHIATRPDCVPPEVIAVLARLAREVPVVVELGLQSVHDETLRRIRRGHDAACFFDALHRLHDAGLPVCVHIINGLPGEDAEDMLDTARALAGERIEFLKIHALHVLSGTALADEYRAGQISLLSQEDYTDITCRQLELLPPETVICRLTGDGDGGALLAPDWTRNKRAVLNGIDRWFAEHDSMQGIRYSGGTR